MTKKITAADEEYHIEDTLIFPVGHPAPDVVMDGKLQTENPEILTLKKNSAGPYPLVHVSFWPILGERNDD